MSQVSSTNLRTLLVCSFRYSLGRQTYMPSLVQSIIKQHWEDLEDSDLLQFADDIDRSKDSELGANFDARDWRLFAEWCRSQVRQKRFYKE